MKTMLENNKSNSCVCCRRTDLPTPLTEKKSEWKIFGVSPDLKWLLNIIFINVIDATFEKKSSFLNYKFEIEIY